MNKQLILFCIFFTLILGFDCSLDPPLPFSISHHFIPCGWIECGKYGDKYMQLQTNYADSNRSDGACFKVHFDFLDCSKQEGGIYWINKQEGTVCNFGEYPGEDFSKKGYTRLAVSLKGEKGGERIKILTGGINEANKPFKDADEVSQFETLSTEWKTVYIDISKRSLKNVINGFGWYATASDNPEGATFYIDDIQLE